MEPNMSDTKPKKSEPKMTQQEVNERVNQILPGGRLRKRIFI